MPVWTYGNYGGGNYTGGVVGGNDYNVRPRDATDSLFRSHDWAYGAAQRAPADVAAAIIWQADRQLIEGLQARQPEIARGLEENIPAPQWRELLREQSASEQAEAAFRAKQGLGTAPAIPPQSVPATKRPPVFCGLGVAFNLASERRLCLRHRNRGDPPRLRRHTRRRRAALV